jgi:hypothetical protein
VDDVALSVLVWCCAWYGAGYSTSDGWYASEFAFVAACCCVGGGVGCWFAYFDEDACEFGLEVLGWGEPWEGLAHRVGSLMVRWIARARRTWVTAVDLLMLRAVAMRSYPRPASQRV